MLTWLLFVLFTSIPRASVQYLKCWINERKSFNISVLWQDRSLNPELELQFCLRLRLMMKSHRASENYEVIISFSNSLDRLYGCQRLCISRMFSIVIPLPGKRAPCWDCLLKFWEPQTSEVEQYVCRWGETGGFRRLSRRFYKESSFKGTVKPEIWVLGESY